MSAEFSVDLDQLDDVTGKLRGFKEFVTDHLTELDKRVAEIGN